MGFAKKGSREAKRRGESISGRFELGREGVELVRDSRTYGVSVGSARIKLNRGDSYSA